MAETDLTLDEIRAKLAPLIAQEAAFDGWKDEALAAAALGEGLDPDVARLAFPGGPIDMIAAWIESVDAAMVKAFPADKMAGIKMRDRIRALVQFRLQCASGKEEALRRALSIMAMPQNAPKALKLGWNSADVMWRLAGDTATDYNHYTKRATLAGIYAATLTVFVSDTSEDKAETTAFLDHRIEGVMRFEKTKAHWLREREGFSVTRFLGRLRYPAR